MKNFHFWSWTERSTAQHTTLLKSLSHYLSLSLSLFLYFTLANIRAVRQFLWSVGVYAVGYVAVVVVVDVVVVFYFFSFSLLCQCFLPGSYRDDNPMPIIDLIVCWFDCINYCSCLVEVFRIAVIAFFVVQNFFCSDFILLYIHTHSISITYLAILEIFGQETFFLPKWNSVKTVVVFLSILNTLIVDHIFLLIISVSATHFRMSSCVFFHHILLLLFHPQKKLSHAKQLLSAISSVFLKFVVFLVHYCCVYCSTKWV